MKRRRKHDTPKRRRSVTRQEKVSRKRPGTGLRQSVPLLKSVCRRRAPQRGTRRRKRLPVGEVPRNGVNMVDAAGSAGSHLFRVVPSVHRYFHFPETNLQSTVVLPAGRFTDDNGEGTNAFQGMSLSGYSNLYLNGVMQEGRTFSIHPAALTLHLGSDMILAGTPVIIENVEFTMMPDTA